MISNIPFKDLRLDGSGLAYITQEWAAPSPKYISGKHNGVDVGSKENKPQVTSIYPGIVKEAGFDVDPIRNPYGLLGYGQYVRVWSPTKDGWIEILYAHFGWLSYYPGGILDGILVKQGQWVDRGTPVLGIMGSTGYSTGKHCHIAKRLRNKNGIIISNSGWTDYVDPTEDIFNPDLSQIEMQTNVKLLKDQDSPLIVVALPVTSEEALKSLALNFGYSIPTKPDGSVDWPQVQLNGTFKLQ